MIKPSILKYMVLVFTIWSIHHYLIARAVAPPIKNSFTSIIKMSDLVGKNVTTSNEILKKNLSIGDTSIQCYENLAGNFTVRLSNDSTQFYKVYKKSDTPFKLIHKGGSPRSKLHQVTPLSRVELNYIEHININADYKNVSQATHVINFKQLTYSDIIFSKSSLHLQGDTLEFLNCNLTSSTISAFSILTEIHNCSFNQAVLTPGAGKLNLTNVRIDSTNSIRIDDTCKIDRVYGTGTLEFYTSPAADILVSVILKDVDIERLRYSDQEIKIVIDKAAPYKISVKNYKYLLKHYEDWTDERKEYDIEYQKLFYHHSGDWWTPIIRKNWDNFGYNKDYIFGNAIMLMCLFFSLNLFLYPRILNQGYLITEFQKANNSVAAKYNNAWIIEFLTIINCLLYTGFLFWGLKLSLEKIKISNIGFALLIIGEYIVGIICLAYIANIIITK